VLRLQRHIEHWLLLEWQISHLLLACYSVRLITDYLVRCQIDNGYLCQTDQWLLVLVPDWSVTTWSNFQIIIGYFCTKLGLWIRRAQKLHCHLQFGTCAEVLCVSWGYHAGRKICHKHYKDTEHWDVHLSCVALDQTANQNSCHRCHTENIPATNNVNDIIWWNIVAHIQVLITDHS
jgi:hypothetical protein